MGIVLSKLPSARIVSLLCRRAQAPECRLAATLERATPITREGFKKLLLHSAFRLGWPCRPYNRLFRQGKSQQYKPEDVKLGLKRLSGLGARCKFPPQPA